MLSFVELVSCFGLAAADRHGVDVEDAGLVAVEEDRLLVGRKRAPAEARRVHELLDRVLLHGLRLRGFLFRIGGLFGDQSFVRQVRFCLPATVFGREDQEA